MLGVSVYRRLEGVISSAVSSEPGRTEEEIIAAVWRDCGRVSIPAIRQVIASCIASKQLFRRQDWFFLPGQLQVRGVLVSKFRGDIYVQQQDFLPIWQGDSQQLICLMQGLRTDQPITLWERCGEDFTGRHILATVGAVSIIHSGLQKAVIFLKETQKIDESTRTTRPSGDAQLQSDDNAHPRAATSCRHRRDR